MNEGESENLKFPIIIFKDKFTEKEWEGIDDMVINIVLGVYPEKTCL